MIRKARKDDIDKIVKIYDSILESEAKGETSTGWIKGVYPTEDTALSAFEAGTLFVMEEEEGIVASARIDKNQAPEYKNCLWEYDADDDEVMVIHTLVVEPRLSGRGYGGRFVEFYEEQAKKEDCSCLRMDTNERNKAARGLYKKLGYRECGIVPCVFNGIEGVRLVCLEKKLKEERKI